MHHLALPKVLAFRRRCKRATGRKTKVQKRNRHTKVPLGAGTNKGTRSNMHLSNTKQTMVLNSFFIARTVCLHSLKVAPVIRLISNDVLLKIKHTV